MPAELTCSEPSTSDNDPTYLELIIPQRPGVGRLRPITEPNITFKGNINRGTTHDWRACLGFMTEQEAQELNLADAIANNWVACEPPESSDRTQFEMSGIPATGPGPTELKGWLVKTQVGQLIFKGPQHLGRYELYLPFTDEQSIEREDQGAITIKSRNLPGLGGIAEPAAPANPLKRYTVLPSIVMPTAWMLDKAVFLGNSGTLRVFAVVVRFGSPVNGDPVGIPYVVEATKDVTNVTQWNARNIHTASIEAPSAIQCENELIMWEYRGGSKWTLYRQPFFAQKAPPS